VRLETIRHFSRGAALSTFGWQVALASQQSALLWIGRLPQQSTHRLDFLLAFLTRLPAMHRCGYTLVTYPCTRIFDRLLPLQSGCGAAWWALRGGARSRRGTPQSGSTASAACGSRSWRPSAASGELPSAPPLHALLSLLPARMCACLALLRGRHRRHSWRSAPTPGLYVAGCTLQTGLRLAAGTRRPRRCAAATRWRSILHSA
jgi:hypothetical protein